MTGTSDGSSSGGRRVLLDWRHATTGPMAPCVLCGRPSLLRSPGKQVPCHKTCAEHWYANHPRHSAQQAQLTA